MDWNQLLLYILETLIGLVITVGIPYAFSLLRQKVKNEQMQRVISRVEKLVSDTVRVINQTYVDEMKEKDLFDEKAQKEAFELCKQNVLCLLNKEAYDAICETFGDFEGWIRTQIESTVRAEKLFGTQIAELPEGDGVDAE